MFTIGLNNTKGIHIIKWIALTLQDLKCQKSSYGQIKVEILGSGWKLDEDLWKIF